MRRRCHEEIVRPVVCHPRRRAPIALSFTSLPSKRDMATHDTSRPDILEPLVDDIPGDDIPPRHEVVRASARYFR